MPMSAVLEIDRLDDPRLADFAHRTDVALRHDQKTAHGLYIAESALVLERAVGAGHRPRAVLCLGGSVPEAIAALGPFADETPIFTGDADLLAELTGYALHRGIVASLDRPPLASVDALLSAARRVVIVENVTDPTNVGAIFRSAGAIGADAILVTPRCSDPFYRRAIRVAMGTVLQVPWTRTGDWDELGPQLVAHGFTTAALALTDASVSLRAFAATAPERVALVLGTEGEGLTDAALAASDVVVRIPMRHGIDSLNVAAAAAVAMFALAE
jgi:tRNA G18 (ribose-2'-O)-methylase SpoU